MQLVTYAESRQAALDIMAQALDSYVIRGVAHNIPLLRDIITEPKFVAGQFTQFVWYLCFIDPLQNLKSFKSLLKNKEKECLIDISGDTSTNYLPTIYPDGFKGKTLTSTEELNLIAVASVVYRYGNHPGAAQLHP